MNEFKFSCPHCQQKIQATPEYAGMQINCPSCQTTMVVPAPPESAAPPPGKLTKAPSPVQHIATSPVMATTMVRKAKKPRVGLYVGLGVGVVVIVAAIFLVPKAMDKYQEHKDAVAAAKAAADAAAVAAAAPPELGADEIVKKVDETYKGLTSFSAQAASVGTFDMSEVNPTLTAPQVVTAKLSILLARPNLYRFEWEREAGPKTMKGAVWSAGKGDYVRTGAAATKVKNRDAALNTAGRVSGTLGVGFAGFFFDPTNSLASVFKNYSKSNNESINGHKCYVLAGEANSQNIVIWIHKDDFLIAQAELIMGGKIDDSMLAGMTAAQKAQAKAMMKVKGNITETYDDIETNKELKADAFQKDFSPNAKPKHKKQGDPNAAGGSARIKLQ